MVGSTARILVAQNGHTDIVKNLIEANADVKMQYKDSIIALISAAQNGCSDM